MAAYIDVPCSAQRVPFTWRPVGKVPPAVKGTEWPLAGCPLPLPNMGNEFTVGRFFDMNLVD